MNYQPPAAAYLAALKRTEHESSRSSWTALDNAEAELAAAHGAAIRILPIDNLE